MNDIPGLSFSALCGVRGVKHRKAGYGIYETRSVCYLEC